VRYRLVEHDLDEALPLIYMWEIHSLDGELLGRYVGKAKAGANRPFKHYRRNVLNLLRKKPYRKAKPDGYRRVHHALARAEREGLQVTLQFLCNVGSHENMDEVEQKYIREKNCVGPEPWQLNGRDPMGVIVELPTAFPPTPPPAAETLPSCPLPLRARKPPPRPPRK
jgi:hypothetical protein